MISHSRAGFDFGALSVCKCVDNLIGWDNTVIFDRVNLEQESTMVKSTGTDKITRVDKPAATVRVLLCDLN